MSRPLPADVETERALLGACILDQRAAETAIEMLEPGDFLKPVHRDIFAAIVSQVRLGSGRVDIVRIANALDGDDKLALYLHGLQNDTPSISNAPHYAEMVAGYSLRRKIVFAADDSAKEAMEGGGYTAEEIAERARERFGALDMPTRIGAPDMPVDAFMASVDMEYDWLIPDLLERKDRMLVTAGEGTGKSVWLRQLAVQTAAGIHPWSGRDMPPRNVLIVDLENSTRQVSRALTWLVKQAGLKLDPARLRVNSRSEGIDLTTRTDRRWLLERCLANQTELLVIGPLYRMHAGVSAKGDIGGEDAARKVTQALDEIRHRAGVALLMETHAPHGDGVMRDLRPFGSSVWLRWPEFGVGIRLDPEREDPDRYLLKHWRGPRDQRIWPKLLLKNAGRWPWTPDQFPTGALTA